MSLLERIKSSLGLYSTEEDNIVLGCIESAKALYLGRRYSMIPDRIPELYTFNVIEEEWIIRAAVELYNKRGAEGQTGHSENGISRTYDSGTISKSLIGEVVPFVGV